MVATISETVPFPPGPTQVVIAPAYPGDWPYPGHLEPGITVLNAVQATVDGHARIAYTSGTDDILTAISY